MSKEPRAGILAAVSDWLKLLALVVLVAEATILAAMSLTPATHPLSAWYPIIMLVFLLSIVGGVFIDQFNRKGIRKLTFGMDGYEASYDPTKAVIEREAIKALDISSFYVDMEKGFAFKRPSSPLWSGPDHLSAFQLAKQAGLLTDPNLNEERFRQTGSIAPLGSMFTGSESVVFKYGNPISIEITDETSNKVIDTIIERLRDEMKKEGEDIDEETILELRRNLLNPQGLEFGKLPIQNSFVVMIFDKSLAQKSPVEPNLGNLFSNHQFFARDIIDNLVADEHTILWGTKNTMVNVLLEGKLREFSMYRMYQLVENQEYLFMISINWTPQAEDSIALWDELKEMLGSFQMIV